MSVRKIVRAWQSQLIRLALKKKQEAAYSAYKNDAILANKWLVKMNSGLLLVIWSVYLPIIGHFYWMTSFLYTL